MIEMRILYYPELLARIAQADAAAARKAQASKDAAP